MTITIPPIYKKPGINEYKTIQKETDETKIQPKKDDTVIISKEAKEAQFKQKVNEAVLTAEPPSNKTRIEEAFPDLFFRFMGESDRSYFGDKIH
jgi:hypothetical protein